MKFEQRLQLYKSKVATSSGSAKKRLKTSDAIGVSNSAKFVENGLFAFNVNFDQIQTNVDEIQVNCLVRFPPEDEILFTIVVGGDAAGFKARLAEMRVAGSTAPDAPDIGTELEVQYETEAPPSTGNNKNVKGYIGRDGNLYLRNKGFWDELPVDLHQHVRPISIDAIFFAIWPPAATARRSLLAREFTGYLAGAVGRQKLHELDIWPAASAAKPSMKRKPATIPVAEIVDAVTVLGGHYPNGEVQRFHAAINFVEHKHFVILKGISGTGKTQLAIQYAKAVHGLTKGEQDPFLFVCPVRPEWTDPSGLTGYHDVLTNKYVVPPFLEALMIATAHPDSPVFVVLDELNLARVEYYLSDILSSFETEEPIQLHTGGTALEGSTGTPVNPALPLPRNLYIVGTINVDETTHPISDKVLDRSMVIDMSTVDIDGYLKGLSAKDPALAASVAACSPTLVDSHKLMAKHGLGFGYRLAKEVVSYHAFVAQHMPADAGAVLEHLMVQKLLVKLRGSERQRPLLNGLQAIVKGMPKAESLISDLLTDLDEFGSFQASK